MVVSSKKLFKDFTKTHQHQPRITKIIIFTSEKCYNPVKKLKESERMRSIRQYQETSRNRLSFY